MHPKTAFSKTIFKKFIKKKGYIAIFQMFPLIYHETFYRWRSTSNSFFHKNKSKNGRSKIIAKSKYRMIIFFLPAMNHI